MKYTVLLDRNEKTHEIEKQEQARFVRAILDALEVPIEYNPDKELTPEEKGKLRKSLAHFNISIIESGDGNLKIYAEKDLIGEFYKSIYNLKVDRSNIDPRKRAYVEMNIKFWSIFEDEESNDK
jgi:hypothetical protein